MNWPTIDESQSYFHWMMRPDCQRMFLDRFGYHRVAVLLSLDDAPGQSHTLMFQLMKF